MFFNDTFCQLVENAFNHACFRGVYQQNPGFIHKIPHFLAGSLAWLGYSDIFALTIFIQTKNNQNYEQSRID